MHRPVILRPHNRFLLKCSQRSNVSSYLKADRVHEQPSRTTTKWTDERKHRGSELPSALQPVFTAIVPAVSSSGRAVNARRPRGKKPRGPLGTARPGRGTEAL